MTQIVDTIKKYISQLGYSSATNRIAIVEYHGIPKIHSIITRLSYQNNSKPYEKIYSFGGVSIFESQLTIDNLFKFLDMLSSFNYNDPEISRLASQGLDFPEKYKLVCDKYKLNVVGNFSDSGRLYGSQEDMYIKREKNTSVWIFSYGLNSNYTAQAWPDTDFSRSRPPYENVQDCINDKLGFNLGVYSNSPQCVIVLPISKARIDSCEIDGENVKFSIIYEENFRPKSLFFNIVYDKGMERGRSSQDITTKNKEIAIKTEFKAERVTAHLIDDDLQLDVLRSNLFIINDNSQIHISTNKPSEKQEMSKEPTIFISHAVEDIEIVRFVNDVLKSLGLEVFIAHQDIKPVQKWEDVIFERLKSSVIFVPILTRAFKKSEWTGQESGIALSSGSTIIPVIIDLDPYGFMKKYQGLRWNRNQPYVSAGKLASQIIEHLPSNSRTKIRKEIIENLRNKDKCDSFGMAVVYTSIIANFTSLNQDEIDLIVTGVIENDQVNNSEISDENLNHIFSKYTDKLGKYKLHEKIKIYLS